MKYSKKYFLAESFCGLMNCWIKMILKDFLYITDHRIRHFKDVKISIKAKTDICLRILFCKNYSPFLSAWQKRKSEIFFNKIFFASSMILILNKNSYLQLRPQPACETTFKKLLLLFLEKNIISRKHSEKVFDAWIWTVFLFLWNFFVRYFSFYYFDQLIL